MSARMIARLPGVSEIKNGKINCFSLSMLVRLAQRAGLRPGIKLQKVM